MDLIVRMNDPFTADSCLAALKWLLINWLTAVRSYVLKKLTASVGRLSKTCNLRSSFWKYRRGTL